MDLVMRSATHEVELITRTLDATRQTFRVRTLPDRYLVGYFDTVDQVQRRLGPAAYAALKVSDQ